MTGGCSACGARHLFFELGLNRGQTLEQQLLRTHPQGRLDGDRNRIGPLLQQVLGVADSSGDFAFHGFEANPAFTVPLRELEARLRQRAACACVHLNLETVAGTSDGRVPFYLDGRTGCSREGRCFGPSEAYYSEGSTFDATAGHRLRNMRTLRNATSVDVGRYIVDAVGAANRRARAERRQRPKVALRMDVEGGEYALLPHLLRPSGPDGRPALCLVDLLMVGTRGLRARSSCTAAVRARARARAACGAPCAARRSRRLTSCQHTRPPTQVEFHAKRHSPDVVAQHATLKQRFARECPDTVVALDPNNYEKAPWKGVWPRPAAWLAAAPPPR